MPGETSFRSDVGDCIDYYFMYSRLAAPEDSARSMVWPMREAVSSSVGRDREPNKKPAPEATRHAESDEKYQFSPPMRRSPSVLLALVIRSGRAALVTSTKYGTVSMAI